MGLKTLLEDICKSFPAARHQQFSQHPVAQKIRTNLKNELIQLVEKYQSLKAAGLRYSVKASPGSGNWADVVWAAIFDLEITDSAQRGFYPVYLFKPDGSGVYLSLNQGTTDTVESEREALRARVRNSDAIRSWGDESIKLDSNTSSGLGYESPNITAKFYQQDQIPRDDLLERDLFELLDLYNVAKHELMKVPTIQEPKGKYGAVSFSLNQVLYGPPGTGKTFNTVDLAWQILNEGNPVDITRPGSIQELKSLYPGQVEFVTFHQSFSYEDFVEGIQAKTQDGKISYQVESGVFKRIAKLASKNLEDSQKSINQLVEDFNLDKRYDDFITHAIESEVAFKKKKGTEFKIINTDDERLTIESPDSTFSGGEVQLKVEELKRVFQSDYPFQSAREVHEQIFINKYKYTRQEDTYYLSLVNAFREFSVPSELSSQADVVYLKPHVLIIDEINRGNISRIFGELITLIEPSKREGSAEAIEVTLPYSKETFSVPKNLYIIGTMNTADRSLALMDTALRRRFDFIEMMPLPGLVLEDLEGVNVRKMLEVMNQRIEALYDREHTLGHAFLMNLQTLNDLRHAFKNKILPLLEEYFYDDWQKIRWVLGASADNFYQRQSFTNLFTDTDAPNEKFQRKNLDDLNAQAFQAIYQGV